MVWCWMVRLSELGAERVSDSVARLVAGDGGRGGSRVAAMGFSGGCGFAFGLVGGGRWSGARHLVLGTLAAAALVVCAAPARAATSHTAYVANGGADTVTPIDTATNTAGDARSRSGERPGSDRDHPRRQDRLRRQHRRAQVTADRHRHQHRRARRRSPSATDPHGDRDHPRRQDRLRRQRRSTTASR